MALKGFQNGEFTKQIATLIWWHIIEKGKEKINWKETSVSWSVGWGYMKNLGLKNTTDLQLCQQTNGA